MPQIRNEPVQSKFLQNGVVFMNTRNNSYVSLAVWIIALLLMGWLIGFFSKSEINIWYSTLHRPPLTPPNYVFPMVWTILYAVIGICGWIIWRKPEFSHLRLVKNLYATQLILNWMWTPLFFYQHLIGLSLLNIILLVIVVSLIIYFAYRNIKTVSMLMIPYVLWLLFAAYLNFYIWQNN
jgi:tryptophan-rich sensory protein